MSLCCYHPKMILRCDAPPAFKVAAPRSNPFVPAIPSDTSPEQSRPLSTLLDFDERGAATFAHLASEQTIAQVFRQVYYVNKYATNFCEHEAGGMCLIRREPVFSSQTNGACLEGRRPLAGLPSR